jgi:ubiquinone/menaquinone biosynthesis C-methylase UbiE
VLAGVDTGIVSRPTDRVLIGWVLSAGAGPPAVTIRFDGHVIARTHATVRERLADGREYLRFRREIRGTLLYAGRGDTLTVDVDGKQLPFEDGADAFTVTVDRPSCLPAMIARLEGGFVLNKYGNVRRPVRTNHRWQRAVFGLFEQLERDLAEEFDLELIPFYGTMLGAIREGDFLGHDDDFDTIYVASGSDPEGVKAEFLAVCRFLVDRGYDINPRAWHVWVSLPGVRGRLDIFYAWFDEDDWFHVGYGYHGPKVRRSDDFHRRVPVPLGEHEIRVPANAEELLTQLYGPDWRRPDPGFTHKGPTRIIDERYRLSFAERTEIHWRRFYRDNQIEGSSRFARFIAERFPDAHTLVEFGCGTGRDSVFFATQGYDVHASDRSTYALERAEEARRHANVDGATFRLVDAADAEQVRAFLADRPTRNGELPLIYLRFVLHAMPVEVEEVLLDTVSEVLEDGFSLCAEFRTLEDADRSKVFGDHQRRYIDDAAFAAKLAGYYGMRVEHHEARTGLSPFQREDPHLARIIAVREGPAPR